MLFCSQQFLFFFLVVFGLYWALPWQRGRVALLLLASYYFYASWSQWLACLICATSVMDFVIARGLDTWSSPRRRRLLLGSSLVMNLGLLAYFKYANFFLASLEQALHAAGVSASLPVLRVLLPVGISFYTFEAISYTVDVYRRRLPAERNLAHFMLFILFFPHLVAGPIVRARDFLPQVCRPKRWNWPRLHLGVQYFLMGLFKKLAIADHMAPFADPIFADPAQYRTGAVWLAVLAYALQVYCDFSGYSDMALGMAHLFGYKLKQNFAMPYLAPNLAEFWRRWHISLSSWLRDYVYYPLGGSRCSTWQRNRNLLLTMTLCGLWHGAAWPFVVFGALQGLLLIGHRRFVHWCDQRPACCRLLQTKAGTAIRIALTFGTFACSVVIFRSPTLASGLTMWQRLFVPRPGLCEPLKLVSLLWTVAMVVLCHALVSSGAWQKLAARAPAAVLGWGYGVVLTLVLVLAPHAGKSFIYFQF